MQVVIFLRHGVTFFTKITERPESLFSLANRDLMSRKAIYPGTFDPFTNGHLDVLERALNIFDHVDVVLAENSQKQTLFSV